MTDDPNNGLPEPRHFPPMPAIREYDGFQYTAGDVARARREALEEAAQVCERRCTERAFHTTEDTEAEECAAAIRALIDQKPDAILEKAKGGT